jgi:hypothetical protein
MDNQETESQVDRQGRSGQSPKRQGEAHENRNEPDPYVESDGTGTGRYDADDGSTHDGLGGVSGSLGNRSDLSGQRADWDNGMIGTTPEGKRPLGQDSSESETAATDEERMRAQGSTLEFHGSGASSRGGIETIGTATSDAHRDRDPNVLGAGPQGRVQVTGATDTNTMPGEPNLDDPDDGDVGDVRRAESSARRATTASDEEGRR